MESKVSPRFTFHVDCFTPLNKDHVKFCYHLTLSPSVHIRFSFEISLQICIQQLYYFDKNSCKIKISNETALPSYIKLDGNDSSVTNVIKWLYRLPYSETSTNAKNRNFIRVVKTVVWLKLVFHFICISTIGYWCIEKCCIFIGCQVRYIRLCIRLEL